MKRPGWLLFLIVIHLYFLTPLFQKGFYQTHDGNLHLIRFEAYAKALRNLQIPPRWAPDLNYSYGSPELNFFYPLPGYLGALLRLSGVSLQQAFKWLIGISFVLASVLFFLWLRQTMPPGPATVGALLYGLAPYHLLDLYVRGDLGEIMSLVFVPIVFLALDKILYKPSLIQLSLGAFAYAGLILSHQAVALMFSPFLLIYLAFKVKQNKQLILISLVSLGLGLCLASYFWIPALHDYQYINNSLFSLTFRKNFLSFPALITSPWGFGPEASEPGGLAPQIGLFQFELTGLAVIVLLLFSTKKFSVWPWLILFITGAFLSTRASIPLWENFSLLQKFQFPWRFIILPSFASAVLCARLIANLVNAKLHYALCLIVGSLIIGLGLPLIKTAGLVDHPDTYYLNFSANTALHREATTAWTIGDPAEFPASPVEFTSGKAQLILYRRYPTRHFFIVDAQQNITVVDNTIYFPGWQLKINGIKTPIQFQNPWHRGLITFNLPRGQSLIEVYWRETKLRTAMNLLSFFTLLGLIAIIIYEKKLSTHCLTLKYEV